MLSTSESPTRLSNVLEDLMKVWKTVVISSRGHAGCLSLPFSGRFGHCGEGMTRLVLTACSEVLETFICTVVFVNLPCQEVN